jgi:glycosyltransferase involved in cell wall biosynthesis
MADKIAISVLTFERPVTTVEFMARLWEHTTTPFDLFVVDNGSQLGTKEVLLRLSSETPGGGRVHLALLDGNAGWARGKNLGLALPYHMGYDYVVLIENDNWFRAIDHQQDGPIHLSWHSEDWLSMHIRAMTDLGLPVIQGRHAVREHPDEGYFWRVVRGGWPLRIHDELLTRALFISRGTVDAIGGFNEVDFPYPLGMYCDTEWSDRVLRWSSEFTGLPFGVSLDERVCEFKEIKIADDQYPDRDKHHEWGMKAHAETFWNLRNEYWEGNDPNLYRPFSDWVMGLVGQFKAHFESV